MELELTTSGNNGYVNVLSNGSTLSCKPVSKSEILDMVDNFEKNKKYRVTGCGSSNGDQRYVVKEAVERTYQWGDAAKTDLEFSRFKQDCRKRALDLAYQVTHDMKQFFEINSFVDGEKPIDKDIAKMEMLTALADKYYKWLIDIPE